MTRLLALMIVSFALLACSATAATRTVSSCTGSQLSGSFTPVRGSAGAGSISYTLLLRNVSKHECTVTGLPQGRLLTKAGKALPTHITPAFPGALAAVLVHLKPNGETNATARFSPDVPGVGEPTAGKRCEPVAYWLRVTGQGGGTTKVPIVPPTSVCEHGALRFTAYGTTK